MELSDSQLAIMAGAGDADAYRRLFERYQHPVYNFVYRMVDNAEDASDIVQDAFIKVYNVLAQKEVQNFSAYLYRTARNLAYDEMRRRARFADVDHELLAPEDPNIYADPQRALLLGEQMEKVRQAAGGLNENQRAALILRELEGLDYDEMSEVMDSNRNAIGALLSRARLKFREELRMAHVPTDQVPEECEAVIALLSPYIDGELSATAVGEVESHLARCTFCAAALEEMEEASRSFRVFIPVIPPADMAEAFTGRLQEAIQAGGGEAAGEGEGSTGDHGAEPGPQSPGSGSDVAARSFMSRLAGSRVFWATTALLVAVGLSAFLLAEEIGHDRAVTEFFAGDAGDEESLPAEDLDFMPAVRPAHSDGIELAGDTATAAGQTLPGDSAPEPDPASPGTSSRGKITSGYATPNPVFEDGQLTVMVTVSGKPDTVTVGLGSAMTVTLTRQNSTGSGEVWSWTGTAPGFGDYAMTATASYGSEKVSASIGTLKVMYVLY